MTGLTRLLTFGISFSKAVNAEVVAKPLVLCIPVLTSFIFVLRIVLVAKLLISGILSSIFFILALYSVFLTTSFLTTLLSLLKSTGTGANLLISNLSTLLFELLELVGKLFNLWISNLSTSVFRLAKIDFSAKLQVSTCEIFLISVFVAQLDKTTLTLISPPNASYSLEKY